MPRICRAYQKLPKSAHQVRQWARRSGSNTECSPPRCGRYDKVWVGPLPPDATVADLRDAINAIYANGGIKVVL